MLVTLRVAVPVGVVPVGVVPVGVVPVGVVPVGVVPVGLVPVGVVPVGVVPVGVVPVGFVPVGVVPVGVVPVGPVPVGPVPVGPGGIIEFGSETPTAAASSGVSFSPLVSLLIMSCNSAAVNFLGTTGADAGVAVVVTDIPRSFFSASVSA